MVLLGFGSRVWGAFAGFGFWVWYLRLVWGGGGGGSLFRGGGGVGSLFRGKESKP